MGYSGKIATVYFSNGDDKEAKEAIEIIDTIAEEDNRSGRQVAKTLIIRAGKDRAKAIKGRKAQSKQSVTPIKSESEI